ncbi:MAG: nucleotide-binding protein [Proteobacteria bacterium]|nr:nucleotide-binding protein [Pseudomonadota bacterium]MBU1388748.1 nucleotide-binding protein [Pseudomonadota bacterium]MBU1543089.1 nucleotide-binding protein [Pseudomonadota bacterium]MBU2482032.1 nucleotide-binding protein [Pseudomonadota bacterium]
MNEISKQNIEKLIKLQEAETEIVRLTAVLEKIVHEKIKLNAKLIQFEAGLKEKQEIFSKLEKDCRDLEMEIKILDDRIVKSNEKLRMVKTNKEYQLCLREVDDSKKHKDALETQLLEYMDERDATRTIVEDTLKEYELLKEKITQEQKNIEKNSSDDRELLDEYEARKADIGQTLDKALMTRFGKVSKMNKGLVVVPVRNEVCMGCFMNIPPQLYIEVQRGDVLISCPQCSRILYYRNS